MLAVSAGVAGCSSLSGSGDDDDGETENGDAADIENQADNDYLNWIGESVVADAGRVTIGSTTQSALDTFEAIADSDDGEIGEDILGQHAADVDYDVDVDAVDHAGLIGQYHVVVGDVDTAAAIEELETQRDESYEQVDEYDGYDVYESVDRNYAFGSTGEVLISATNREWLETAVDVNTGNESPLSDDDERLDEIDSHLEYRDAVNIELREEEFREQDGDADEMVAWGVGMDVGEDEITARLAHLYTDEDVVTELEDEIEDEEVTVQILGIGVEPEQVDDISTDGRIITVDVTVPTEVVIEPEE